ncbi:MAG: hypothetical protein KR126chlam6_01399 [Candidatus Anoxychlamydiales bacterium]|nr:hypothetical protein [Candidatus Anoxychlamydiales bacterium]
MFFKFFKNISLICFILCSCSNRDTSNMASAQDFILASYKINEGKKEILQMQGLDVDNLSADLLENSSDVIEETDILNIEVYHPKRVDLINSIKSISKENGFAVLDGKIFFPDLGYFEVANLSLKEAKEKIQKRFQDEIKDIEIFISFKEKKPKKVEVAGIVTSEVFIDSKTRIFDILIKVKLPSNANLFKSYILRDNAFLSVDFYKLLKEGDMSQNIYVKNGDKIYIAESSSSKVYVLGEVCRQGYIEIPDGKISLKEAIAKVGGILYTADKSLIQVFRANVQDPKIYHLNWKYITELPNSCLNLIEGDIVYVSSTIISDWNKFITQILPTISLVDSAYRGFKNMGIIIDGG